VVVVCADRPLATNAWTVTYDGTNIISNFTVGSAPSNFTYPCSPLGGSVYATDNMVIAPGSHILTVTGTTVNNISSTASVTFYQPPYGVTVRAQTPNVTDQISTSEFGNFTVTNVGGDSGNYSLAVSCSGAAIATSPACSVSPTTLPLGSAATTTVQVFYTTSTTPLATGNIALTVTEAGNNASAASSMSVRTVQLLTPPVNAGTAARRDRCFRAYAARNAEYECGALRYSYALPTIHRVGKSVTPRLIYSSAAATPHPLIAADVVLPAHGDSVAYVVQAHVILDGAGSDVCNSYWRGKAFPVGETRRIVCALNVNAGDWGLHSYVLQVQATLIKPPALQPTGTLDITTIDSVSGWLLIQNGYAGPFGAGWYLEGVESFATAAVNQPAVWQNSDGSLVEYMPNTSNTVWHPVPGGTDHADSITLNADSSYTHWEPHGMQVKIYSFGIQKAVVDPLGYTTTFSYNGPHSNISEIQLPQMTGTGATPITITYAPPADSGSGTATNGDPTINMPNGTGGTVPYHVHLVNQQLAWISSPDGDTVKFEVTNGLLTSVTDKNANVTTFTYDSAYTLTSSTINMGSQPAIVRHFRAAEGVGIGGPLGTPDSLYVPPDSATTVITGPRTDSAQVTTVWLDNLGQAVGSQDAHGQLTAILHTDTRWPGLPTEVVYPNGQIVTAVYDTHGNLQTETDANPYGTGDATTTYAYDPKWDLVTSITSPTGVVTSMAYDQTDANRLWQQPGSDTADHSHRTIFVYDANTKLMTLIYPPTMPERQIAYDTLGNVNKTTSGLGHKTWFNNDALGRDTLTAQQLDSVGVNWLTTRYEYDALGRDTLTKTYGPALTNTEPHFEVTATAPESLTVRTYYNREGVVDSVKRWMSPDTNHIGTSVTGYRYDPAYRVIHEVDPLGFMDTSTYDPAGNRTAWTTRRKLVVTSSYDALNRLSQKITPAVTYPPGSNTGTPQGTWTFPWGPYQNSTGGYTIAADTANFTYDPAGHLLTAQNSNAQVHRQYYLDGSIKLDTLIIRSYVGTNWSLHLYGLGYNYDLDGRRIKLARPSQFTGGPTTDTTYYKYDALTGQLDSLTDFYADTFAYTYDDASRMSTLKYPGGITDTYTYDGDSRLSTRLEASSTLTLHNDRYTYDWRDKQKQVTTLMDTTYFLYSAMGNLVWSHNSPDTLQAKDVEIGLPDALGNHSVRNYQSTRIGAQTTDNYAYTYQAKTSRLLSATGSGYTESAVYDTAGDRESYISSNSTFYDEQVSYYAADNQLRALDHRRCNTPGGGGTCGGLGGTFEEYRYDALGRRILVRSNRLNLCGGQTCRSEIKAIIWDGSQDIYELRADGQGPNGPTDAGLDVYDSPPSNPTTQQFYGRAGYTIGATLDLPLAVERPTGLVKQYFIPHANWHGLFDQGTDKTGALISCTPACIDWPAIPNALDYSLLARQEANLDSWSGDLVSQSRDMSGQMYMRNRYYDPATGRFTQEDPSGLAGGLNAYGFAAGDPVNYSDPFGLCPNLDQCLAEVLDALVQYIACECARADGKPIVTTFAKMAAVHGNSKMSAADQHLYRIYDEGTGETDKFGISGQALNKDGSSPRANRQVNAKNRAGGNYAAEVQRSGIQGREAALAAERDAVAGHVAATGEMPPGQKLPVVEIPPVEPIP
jgi:RHS repeat-associated protein